MQSIQNERNKQLFVGTLLLFLRMLLIQSRILRGGNKTIDLFINRMQPIQNDHNKRPFLSTLLLLLFLCAYVFGCPASCLAPTVLLLMTFGWTASLTAAACSPFSRGNSSSSSKQPHKQPKICIRYIRSNGYHGIIIFIFIFILYII